MSNNLLDSREIRFLKERYAFLGDLGHGGMGRVIKAEDKLLRRVVAIKFLSIDYDPGHCQKAVQRFQREAMALSALSHVNLVRIYDFGVTDKNVPYLVMEYVEGETLKDLIDTRGGLDSSTALEILLQICSGIGHAHGRGIVHRDLKPSNIIISWSADDEPKVTIVDFGISYLLDTTEGEPGKITPSGNLLGSPFYMAPEQAMGEPGDIRTDVYTLGCLAYEMFTGKVPYEGRSALETIRMHLEESPAPLGEAFPPLLEDTIARMLAKSPGNRFDSMAEVESRIKFVLESEYEGSAQSIGSVEQVKTLSSEQFFKDHRLPVSVVSLAVLLMLSVVTIFLFVVNKVGILQGEDDVLLRNIGLIQPAPSHIEVTESDFRRVNSDFFNAETDRDSLNLHGSTMVVDHDLQKIANLKNLRRLDLSETFLGNQALDYLDNPALRILNLEKTLVTDDGLKNLSRSPRLRELNLSSNKIRGHKFEALVALPRLRVLGLNDCRLHPCAASHIGRMNLVSLSLAGSSCADKIAGALVSNRKLEELDMSRSSLSDDGLAKIATLRQLQVLKLGGCGVGDLGLARLAGCDALKEVDLSATRISAGSFPVIAGWQNLEGLSLARLRIDSRVFGSIQGLRKLRSLNLSASRITDWNERGALGSLESLRDLDLSYTRAGDNLMLEVSKLKSLRNLRLGYTAVSSRGLRRIAGSRKLISLELDGCKNFGVEALKPLAALHLKRLSLKGLGLHDEDLSVIAEFSELKSLNLADNAITDLGLMRLSRLGLESIDLSGCSIGPGSLRQLASMKTLKQIFLADCPNLEKSDLVEFRAYAGRNREISF